MSRNGDILSMFKDSITRNKPMGEPVMELGGQKMTFVQREIREKPKLVETPRAPNTARGIERIQKKNQMWASVEGAP